MSRAQNYKRDPNGNRFQLGGMNTVSPPDALPANKYPYLQNVRSYRENMATSRALQTAPAIGVGAAVHSLRRLNDLTPAGPASGYALIVGAGTSLFANAVQVDTGFSGNPMSFVPFRPNTSVQPWMYVADGNKMVKVRSDGLEYKTGIKEPQAAPTVGTGNSTTTGSVVIPSTAAPWSTTQNPTYNFNSTGSTGAAVIHCIPGTTVTLSAAGTVTTASGMGGPGDGGPADSTSPGQYATGGASTIMIGAFTDGSGTVLEVVSLGASTSLTVPRSPAGITQLQIGIDSDGYATNTGSFLLTYSTSSVAIATVVSLLGDVTAYYWGDSPHSGPVAAYIWKNVTDSNGSGPVRDVGNSAGSLTGNSLAFDSAIGNESASVSWTVYDSTGTISGTKALFQPALESEGYADFNVVISGSLFVPAAGAYSFNVVYKDNILWGIGGNATWPGKGSVSGNLSQTVTVDQKLPLLPAPLHAGDAGVTGNSTITVSFPGAGIYPIEIDWDYWDKAGRTLVVTCNGAAIPPLPNTVKQDVQYRYVYRSSATGALSNPSPESASEQIPVQANTITPLFSTDPQVDKVDYYRIDSSLDNFTYVGTGPNTNPPTPFTDPLLDTDIATNAILQFDNYEPFPVIDLPRKGVINVTAGVATWVSGDQFNPRWLPGTVINSGGTSYVFDKRPTSTTTLTAIGITDGTNLPYEIAEPTLAGQPMPSMWGPTDDAAYMFACGDPINPGTLYFTKGNNPDSAPDTNQIQVTSPSEPLVNGAIVNGLGIVFSSERGFLLYPNYTAALATVTGVTGSAFRPTESISSRGLYIRPAICTVGGSLVAWRAKDGIYASSGSGGDESLTKDIYNLFPHEGFLPTPIVLGIITVFPPDDTQPEKQQLRHASGWLYYDYLDTNGTPRTLVLDMQNGGWSVDTYEWPVSIHVLEEGPTVNGVLVGCTDGSVRTLSSTGIEVATSIILTPAMNEGDARADKTIGDIFVKANIVTGSSISVIPYTNRFSTPMTGYSPGQLAASSGLQPYIIDFVDGMARDIDTIAMYFAWAAVAGTYLELWQPDWTELPETTQDRPTDWDDAGTQGAKFFQGFLLEADTSGVPKAFAVQSSDDMSLHVPDQIPVIFNGQGIKAFTFTPPFIAHSVRIVSTDSIPWRSGFSEVSWVTSPMPELTVQWQTEMTSHGMDGWLSLGPVMNIAHISTADITITLVFDQWPTITLTLANSGGLQHKDKIIIPQNKFKLVSYRASSTAPFRLFADQCEVRIGPWGRTDAFVVVKPFGGPAQAKADV